MRARYAWLLDCEAGGTHLRYSVDAEEVETAAGTLYAYAQGLADMAIAASEAEVEIEINDSTVDAPRLGPRLEGAVCTLRRWKVGSVFEAAQVFARGTATGAEWGSRFDAIRWTMRQLETLPPMPELECRVSPATTIRDLSASPTYRVPANQDGLYYPTVFGVPGQRVFFVEDEPADFSEFVVPCPMRKAFTGAVQTVDSEIVVSSDPTMFFPVRISMREDVSEVDARQDETHPTAGLLCKVVADDLGRQIVVATLSDNRLGTLGEDGPVYLMGCGTFDFGIKAPRDAYDVIRYALERWAGDTYDPSRMEDIRDHLRGYLVDTWVTEAPDGGVWGWLVEALGCADIDGSEAAGLPVAIRMGPNGRYFVPLRYTVDPRRGGRLIDATRGEATRESSIRVEGEPINDVTFVYGGDRTYPGWAGASVTGTLVSQDASYQSVTDNDTLAQQSIARYGRRQAEVEVPWTWDPGTASRVALDVLAANALPARRVAYRVPEAWGVREAEQVCIVDPEVALDEYAIVEGPPVVGASTGVLLMLRLAGVP